MESEEYQGARFRFVQFDSEVAAGLAVLKTDNLKWKDRFLCVKKPVFGRGHVARTSSRSVAPFSDVQQDERRGRPPSASGFIERHPPREGRVTSPKRPIRGREGDWWRREAGLGVEGKFLMLGRVKGLLTFDNVEGFNRALLLDDSWWVKRGVKMTPWSESLVIKPMREVWIKSYGVPFHARYPNTFMAIGKQRGDILLVEFNLGESGSIDDGRVQILTETLTPFNFSFKLRVDGRDFDCWAMEN
ncbi:hypothetical protein Dimus_017641 [Dionaea muscipula]